MATSNRFLVLNNEIRAVIEAEDNAPSCSDFPSISRKAFKKKGRNKKL